jgi:hypothetical protein
MLLSPSLLCQLLLFMSKDNKGDKDDNNIDVSVKDNLKNIIELYYRSLEHDTSVSVYSSASFCGSRSLNPKPYLNRLFLRQFLRSLIHVCGCFFREVCMMCVCVCVLCMVICIYMWASSTSERGGSTQCLQQETISLNP